MVRALDKTDIIDNQCEDWREIMNISRDLDQYRRNPATPLECDVAIIRVINKIGHMIEKPSTKFKIITE